MEATRLELRRITGGYLISVLGRATMRESRPIQVFVDSTFAEDSTLGLLIDLSRCSHMDSTFLGLLVMLHGDMNDGEQTRFSLAAPSPKCARSLSVTHLDKLLHIVDSLPEVAASVEPCDLPVEDIDRDSMGRHILECHRALVSLGGSNQPAYQQVVERLIAELTGNR